MDPVGKFLVLRIPGQKLLELGGRDDGVLMLAQDVLKLGGQADEPLCLPIGAAALMSSKIVRDAQLKVYPGFPHGMPTTHADQINADLLAFLTGEAISAAA